MKHGIPAIISFFLPGVGQLMKGHIGKVVLIFFGFWVAAFSVVGVPIAIGFWIWNIVDAYNA